MAEVYIVGQICSADNFREPNLFLRWNFQAGLFNGTVVNVETFDSPINSGFRFTLEIHRRRIRRTNVVRLESIGY